MAGQSHECKKEEVIFSEMREGALTAKGLSAECLPACRHYFSAAGKHWRWRIPLQKLSSQNEEATLNRSTWESHLLISQTGRRDKT
jgi:hypothetical protein